MLEFTPRNLLHTDWISGVLLLILFLMVLAKKIHPDKFNKTLRLFISNKFFLNYGKETNTTFNSFSNVMYIVQMLSFSLTGYLILQRWGQFWQISFELDYPVFFGLISLFLIGKLILVKFLGVVFNIGKLQDYFVFIKNGYLNLIAIYLIPLISLLAYSKIISKQFVYFSTIYILFLFLFSYLLILLNNKKIIFNNFFYFILYICTLEIAPLLIVLKLVF